MWANTDVVLEDLLVQTERQLLTSLYKIGHMSKPESLYALPRGQSGTSALSAREAAVQMFIQALP